MLSLDQDRRSCAPTTVAPLIARAFIPDVPRLTKTEVNEGRGLCLACDVFATCRDFAYVTRMPGFAAATTAVERAEAADTAHAYLARSRAAAKTAGVPFTQVERDRVYTAALKAAHLVKALTS